MRQARQEGEKYGILSVTFEGFSIRSLLRELGSTVELRTMSRDVRYAVGNVLGKLLWIQDAVAKKKVTSKREPSISNVADLGTNPLDQGTF